MSLLDQASLVLVPSAIKTGEVLVQKPLPTKFSDETGNYDGNDPQGSANLTFTRNSNATRVNADGLVEKVRTNLLTYSNDFSNSIWNKFGSVPVSYNNATAPDGTLTASTASFTAAGGGQQIWNTYTFTANTYTDSIYLRSATGSALSFTFGFYDTAGRTKTITVGTTWQRFDHTATLSAIAGRACWLYPNEVNATVEIWHAQMELSDFGPTPYIETTTSARSTFAGITVDGTSVPNVPRLDYSGGATCGRLLLEPQRSNLALYSEQLDNSAWTKSGVTVTANQAISPDGYQNADKVTNATISDFISQIIAAPTATAYAASFYIKNEDSTLTEILVRNSVSSLFGEINWSGSQLVSITGVVNGTLTFEAVGNDWYRIFAYYTSVETIQRVRIFPDKIASGKSVYVWGYQLEQGATYASSYIGPTFGASVTRLADNVSNSNIGNLITGSSFTWFFDLNQWEGASANVGDYELTGAGVRIQLRVRTDGYRVYYQGIAGGSAYPISGSTVFTKCCISYDGSQYRLFWDGEKKATTASIGDTGWTALQSYGGVGVTGTLHIKKNLFFNSALPDAQCIELTTL